MRRLPKAPAPPQQGAGWIITFADLMSLLLTFFILLLSFSEMDIERYRRMAAALAASFGPAPAAGEGQVGGSIIFAEQPPPSQPAESPEALPEPTLVPSPTPPIVPEILPQPELAPKSESAPQLDPHIQHLTERLVSLLQAEISANALSVNFDAEKVLLRFSEATTFPSGSELLKDEMLPILAKIESVLAQCEGEITVTGYTDDIPVHSSRYRSNWDLSAARAVSVVHQLVLNRKIDANRVSAAGRAETNALVPNDSAANRARNRRVEISIYDPQCPVR